jgi:hypothetical protein
MPNETAAGLEASSRERDDDTIRDVCLDVDPTREIDTRELERLRDRCAVGGRSADLGRRTHVPTSLLPLLFLALAALALACGGEGGGDGDADVPVGTCVFDESYGVASPLTDDPREEVSGWLCPLEDEDWYGFSVPTTDRVVRVELEALGARSPTEPVYVVWPREGDAVGDVAARTDPDHAGRPLRDAHCLSPGDYFLEVRDQGDDGQDRRDPYRLLVHSEPEPDANEPNDASEGATPIPSGETRTGYVACRGDRDVFSLPARVGEILLARLSMPETQLVPALRIYGPDGELVVEGTNPGAERGPTSIVLSRVAPADGTYTVVVEDATGARGDPDVAYELSASALEDFDGNEPNDHPREATALASSPTTCGGAWSASFTATGTIGSEGDEDWFALPVVGCRGALVEAELTFAATGDVASQWELQRKVQASVALVRSHPGSPCDRDEGCTMLQAPCESGWDCEGFFNTCLPEGVCAGATVCMSDGLCGANQAQRSYRSSVASSTTEPPPPNRAYLLAPILDDRPLFLRVTDFQSNGGDPAALYTLTVRVRHETDPADATTPGNNLYTPTTLTDVPVRESMSRAIPIAVHDCPAGDCCDSGTWVRGTIGHQHDLDFFEMPHPCPGEDCNVRIHYQVDDGPVDHALWIYESGGGGFISRELPNARSGTFGGVGAEADGCTYAYHRHGERYYVMVRDREDDGADAAPEQSYRFCVEKAANGCQAPCMDFGPERGGCGVR